MPRPTNEWKNSQCHVVLQPFANCSEVIALLSTIYESVIAILTETDGFGPSVLDSWAYLVVPLGSKSTVPTTRQGIAFKQFSGEITMKITG